MLQLIFWRTEWPLPKQLSEILCWPAEIGNERLSSYHQETHFLLLLVPVRSN